MRGFLLIVGSMKIKLFYELRVIDSSGFNKKCAANWGVPVRDSRKRGGGGDCLEKKITKFPVRVNRPLLCQEDRWAYRVDELGQA